MSTISPKMAGLSLDFRTCTANIWIKRVPDTSVCFFFFGDGIKTIGEEKEVEIVTQ